MNKKSFSIPRAIIHYKDDTGQSSSILINNLDFTIGRLHANDLKINNPHVSRQHAEIVFKDNKFFIIDKNSAGGCFVNDNKVEKSILKSGDKIQLGEGTSSILIFELTNEFLTVDSDLTLSSEDTDQSLTLITREKTRFLDTYLLENAENITETTLNRLKHFNTTTRKMLSVRTKKDLLTMLLEATMEELPAERGVVLMPNLTGKLEIQVFYNRSERNDEVKPSSTIVEKVFRENIALYSFDALADTRFSMHSSVTQQSIHSVICAPISSPARIWGVCYIDNVANYTQFNSEELEYFLALTQQAGLIMENLHLIEELNSTQEKLIYNGKLVTLGQFSSGIAHELRNQLTTLTAAEILMNYIEDQELKKLIQLILNAQQRMLSMVNEIRGFARQDSDSYKKDLQPLIPIINEALDLSKFDPIVKTIHIITEFKSEPILFINKNKFIQVILNLVRNAAQAVKSDGEIILYLTSIEKLAILKIEDNGCGISPENLSHIWETFYTTKESDGTGLGLGICHRIVEGHFGTITCESILNKGTIFTITLPIPGEP